MPKAPRFALLFLLFMTACSSRPITHDCDSMCQPAGPAAPGVGECKEGVCTPTYAECSDKSEVTTCAQACEAQGSTCATNGCGGYTYRIYSFFEWCEDPDKIGVEVEHDCDDPIDWQVNSAVECCCEQQG
jgi:hypothetical protein